jgi:phospholipase/carboxylesterase
MINVYHHGSVDRTIVLFHGTGGNEYDLIPIARHLDPLAHILSLRGRINERGMNRFFKRLAPGVFDLDSLKEETEYIIETIKKLKEKYKLKNLVFLGYSNGANIIANMLLQSDFVNKAILLRLMLPTLEIQKDELFKTNVLILSGRFDPIVSLESLNALKHALTERHVMVDHHVLSNGHELVQKDMELMHSWYQETTSDLS